MLPFWLKISYSVLVALIIPIYWRHYGWRNFLWFSDIALLAMVPGLWLENALLCSMMALSVLFIELIWCLDVMTFNKILGITGYIFDDKTPLYIRLLSLFHGVLPILFIYVLYQLRYDPRAFWWQVALGEVVLLASFLLTNPKNNINWVFGVGGQPQKRVSPWAYLIFVMISGPMVVYAPTHWVLNRVFSPLP